MFLDSRNCQIVPPPLFLIVVFTVLFCVIPTRSRGQECNSPVCNIAEVNNPNETADVYDGLYVALTCHSHPSNDSRFVLKTELKDDVSPNPTASVKYQYRCEYSSGQMQVSTSHILNFLDECLEHSFTVERLDGGNVTCWTIGCSTRGINAFKLENNSCSISFEDAIISATPTYSLETSRYISASSTINTSTVSRFTSLDVIPSSQSTLEVPQSTHTSIMSSKSSVSNSTTPSTTSSLLVHKPYFWCLVILFLFVFFFTSALLCVCSCRVLILKHKRNTKLMKLRLGFGLQLDADKDKDFFDILPDVQLTILKRPISITSTVEPLRYDSLGMQSDTDEDSHNIDGYSEYSEIKHIVAPLKSESSMFDLELANTDGNKDSGYELDFAVLADINVTTAKVSGIVKEDEAFFSTDCNTPGHVCMSVPNMESDASFPSPNSDGYIQSVPQSASDNKDILSAEKKESHPEVSFNVNTRTLDTTNGSEWTLYPDREEYVAGETDDVVATRECVELILPPQNHENKGQASSSDDLESDDSSFNWSPDKEVTVQSKQEDINEPESFLPRNHHRAQNGYIDYRNQEAFVEKRHDNAYLPKPSLRPIHRGKFLHHDKSSRPINLDNPESYVSDDYLRMPHIPHTSTTSKKPIPTYVGQGYVEYDSGLVQSKTIIDSAALSMYDLDMTEEFSAVKAFHEDEDGYVHEW